MTTTSLLLLFAIAFLPSNWRCYYYWLSIIHAYALLVGIAVVMGTWAVVAAISLDKRLVDPEGFLGPSWLRLPLLVGAAFALDLVPRTLWQSRFKPVDMPGVFMTRVRTHWTRERWTLVILGLVCFYVTYVSYRNLKSFLPFVMGEDHKYDRTLHLVDRLLLFGHEPGRACCTTSSARASRPTCCRTSICGSCRWCRSRSRRG